MNSFNLLGRIIEDPIKTETSNGVPMCRLKLSVNKNSKDNETPFEVYEVVLFRNLTKEDYDVGKYVSINGKLSANNYENNGVSYCNVSLVGNNVEIIEG